MNNDLKIVGEVIYFQGYRVADLLSSASVPATVMETFKDYIYDMGDPDPTKEYDQGYEIGYNDGYHEGYNDCELAIPKEPKATPAEG